MVQYVWVEVADGVLSRDFEVHTLCDPRSLLVLPLQSLLIDASHLSPPLVLLIYLNCHILGFWGVLLLLVLLGQLWCLSCGFFHCQYLHVLGPL